MVTFPAPSTRIIVGYMDEPYISKQSCGALGLVLPGRLSVARGCLCPSVQVVHPEKEGGVLKVPLLFVQIKNIAYERTTSHSFNRKSLPYKFVTDSSQMTWTVLKLGSLELISVSNRLKLGNLRFKHYARACMLGA